MLLDNTYQCVANYRCLNGAAYEIYKAELEHDDTSRIKLLLHKLGSNNHQHHRIGDGPENIQGYNLL